MAAPSPPRIVIDHVSKEVQLPKQSMFAKPDRLVILRDLSLEIKPSDLVVIIGKNGTGKSTLLNLIAGLDRPSSGQIWIDQRKLAQMSPWELAEYRNQTLGFITQKPSVITSFSLAENVALPLLFNPHLAPHEREAVYQHAITTFNLRALMYRHPNEDLSGGEGQHLSMARALINDPAIILADEPTSGVDDDYSKLFFRLLREHHQRGKTIVLVTHEQDWQAYFRPSQIRLLVATGSGGFMEIHNDRQKAAMLEERRRAAHAAPETSTVAYGEQAKPAARASAHTQSMSPTQLASNRLNEAAHTHHAAPTMIEQQAEMMIRHCEDLLRTLDREESPTVRESLIREFNHSFKLLITTMRTLAAIYQEGGTTAHQDLYQRYRSLYQIVETRSS